MPGESKTSPRRLAAAERQRAALELRKGGETLESIARALGYRSAASAYRAIDAALRKTLQEPAEAVRKLELARLDALLLGVWPRATRGEYEAVDRALKIMARRAALLGLDAPKRVDMTWREELEQEGIDASEVFEAIVNAIASQARDAGPADG